MISRRLLFVSFFILCLLVPVCAFAQDVSPSDVYKPPATPSCFIISFSGASEEYIDLEVNVPGVGTEYWPIQLYGGQVEICINEYWAEGTYEITGLWYQGAYYPQYATFIVHPAGPPPPVITVAGTGCDNWDCIWAGGMRFQPDSRLIVHTPNWSDSQMFYGSAWGMSPPLSVNEQGDWLAVQVTNPALLYALGWDGVRIEVLDINDTSSNSVLVQAPKPTINWAGPTCSDSYCIQFNGDFPMSALVDFRIPGQGDILRDYTDLVVTPTQITLRLNPSLRSIYDTTGLNAWVVNPTLPNWSSVYYLPPLDRAVIGYIDDVFPAGQQWIIRGWACARTHSGSIDVHVYVGGPAGGGGVMVFGGTANAANEPEVSSACSSTSSNHRFWLQIPYNPYGGLPIYVHGISPLGLSHNLLNNSGDFTMPYVDGWINGNIEGISEQGQDRYLIGWACAKTFPSSIAVHLYAGGPSGGGWGTYAGAVTANLSSDPEIAFACVSTGTNYRFSILLTDAIRKQFGGLRAYVHGISPFGLSNALIGNSGTVTIPPLPQQIQWKKDHIYTPGGAEIVTATPQ